jgi:VIT1/CCC1 family predicted Fe2+/Mn2+ transporter
VRWRSAGAVEDWDLAHGAKWRILRVHFNDGLISAAGILQGLTSAGATGYEAFVAGLATTVIGGMIVLGAEYNEAAGDVASERAIVEAERRRLELTPQEEFDELVQIYQRKGLSPALAEAVARELSERDALGAQLDAEYGISGQPPLMSPWGMGLRFGAAFVIGALVPLILLLISERLTREIVVFLVVGLTLTFSAVTGARSDRTSAWAAVARTLAIGLGSMVVSLVAGSLLSF